MYNNLHPNLLSTDNRPPSPEPSSSRGINYASRYFHCNFGRWTLVYLQPASACTPLSRPSPSSPSPPGSGPWTCPRSSVARTSCACASTRRNRRCRCCPSGASWPWTTRTTSCSSPGASGSAGGGGCGCSWWSAGTSRSRSRSLSPWTWPSSLPPPCSPLAGPPEPSSNAVSASRYLEERARNENEFHVCCK